MLNLNDKALLNALHNLETFIDPTKTLPECVFSSNYKDFLFFESDRIFCGDFVDVSKELISAEEASIVCILNLAESNSFEAGEAAIIVLGGDSSKFDYESSLRGQGQDSGWIYGMDRYICGTDGGEWFIYCEKENDVAVFALHKNARLDKFKAPLEKLAASPITVLCNSPSAAFPFKQLTEFWRNALVENY